MFEVNSIKFFLGSNTKVGFVSLFEEIRNPKDGFRLYILKGGAGCGKSSIMKKVAAILENDGDVVEYIPCASDPNSLDAIIDKKRGIAMTDGTPPHIMEEKFPGAYEKIVNLGEAWNEKNLLLNKEKVFSLSNSISNYHSTATACISAATVLLEQVYLLSSAYVNIDKINDFVQKVFLGEKNTKLNLGIESKRLLSAVSVGEITFFETTLTKLAPIIYKIIDPYGYASNKMLSLLREKSLLIGENCITCYSSNNTPNKIDHLILPGSGIGFTTENAFHSMKNKNLITIKSLYNPIPDDITSELEILLQKSENLIQHACIEIENAKIIHDDLEQVYINAMDFSKVDKIFDDIIKEIYN